MIPNFDAMNDFWYFVNERHRIYLKREANEPKPWSTDPIFQQWKFCNVFRDLDKQSNLLIKNVIDPHFEDEDQSLTLFNIFQFRAFNWFPTYQVLGWTDKWDETYALMTLKNYLGAGNQLSSGAYMLRGRQGIPKYVSIIKSLTDIWNKRKELLSGLPRYTFLGKRIDTLEAACETIVFRNFWGWGEFTAYQVALDLTYSSILLSPEDLNTWTYFGPGATKGIKEIWPALQRKDFLKAAQFLLADQVKYLEEHVPELNLQDIEFCLCELQKYRRIKAGGKGKAKYAGS